MALFQYKALDGAGRQVSGIIDADTSRQARQKLRRQNIYPVDVVEGKDGAHARRSIGFGRVPLSDLSVMTRQFATLVRAGMPIVESLSALIDQIENRYLSNAVAQIREDVREGSALATGMERFPKVFSNLYRNVVMAGERSGTLDIMLERMADHLENQVRQANKISSILMYPVIMLSVGLLIVGILVVSVIPKVVEIFEGMEKALPWPTVVMIWISDFLMNRWWVLVLVVLAVYAAFRKYRSTETGRRKVDIISLGVPLYGRIVKIAAVSRLTRTLSTLISSGVPLLEAIGIAKKVVGNSYMESVLDVVAQNIREGESIAEPLERSGVFPPLLIHMIAIGEKSGELETMLVKVAEAYENEVDTIVNKMTSVLPTVLTIFMGIAVAFIVAAIMLPIFDMSQGIMNG